MSGAVYQDRADKLAETDEYTDEETAPPEESLVVPFSTPMRALTLGSAIVILFLLTGAIAWLLGSHSVKTDMSTIEAAKVGLLAPDFTLTDARTGKPIHLASLRGRPLWINFWATWCPACVEEMPAMKKAYTEYKEKGLLILGVDDDEPPADINNFTTKNGYDWTFLLDPGGKVIDLYRVDGIPTHWFVGKDGILKAVHVGSIPQDEIRNYLTITE